MCDVVRTGDLLCSQTLNRFEASKALEPSISTKKTDVFFPILRPISRLKVSSEKRGQIIQVLYVKDTFPFHSSTGLSLSNQREVLLTHAKFGTIGNLRAEMPIPRRKNERKKCWTDPGQRCWKGVLYCSKCIASDGYYIRLLERLHLAIAK